MPEEMIRTLITINLTMMGIMMADLLTKSRSVINVQHNLESWELNRRAALHSMQIEEARAYLDISISVFQKLMRAGMHSKIIKNKMKTLEEVLSLMHVARTQRYRVDTLNDPLLARLDEELSMVIAGEHDNIAKLIRGVKNSESIHKDHISEKKLEVYEKVLASITKMHVRLDELAQTAP